MLPPKRKKKHKNHRAFSVSEEDGQIYSYCRCCAGTYLRKRLKGTTKFLIIFNTPTETETFHTPMTDADLLPLH